MCLFPKLIFNKKYQSNKKNKGVIPPIQDDRVLYVPVGCGNCIECKKQKARQWTVRLHEELKHSNNMIMVTLTFDEYWLYSITQYVNQQGINTKIEENEVARQAVRWFLERWRKHFGKSVKHWLVTELGHKNTERIHLHGILWTDQEQYIIESIWQYGIVHFGTWVNEQTINYIVKYITKTDNDHKGYKTKILSSKGIGIQYINKRNTINKYNNSNTIEFYKTTAGIKLSLPIYYRNKLYTEEQKEQLWLYKLDKQERYICGTRIDISKSEELYYNTLKWYQLKNKRLGYGDDTEKWNVTTYKRERMIIKNKNKN